MLFSTAAASELRTSSGENKNYNNSSQTTYVGECYSYIRTLVEEGKEDSSLGLIKSMHGICTKNVDLNKVQQIFGDSKSFADFLTKNKYQNLGEKNYFDTSKCTNEKQTPIHEISS